MFFSSDPFVFGSVWWYGGGYGTLLVARARELRAKRKFKRWRYRRNKKLMRHKPPRFRPTAKHYHLVVRCRRRGGNCPCPKHWNVPFRRFQRQLSYLLKRQVTLRATIERSTLHYIDGVYNRARYGSTPLPLDPIKDLDGVPEELIASFCNLHNPLDIHKPMESRTVTMREYLAENPPDNNEIHTPTFNYDDYKSVPTSLWDNLDEINLHYFHQVSSIYEMSNGNQDHNSYRGMPLIWDTGASIGLTPFRSDFIDYQLLENVTVKDIARKNKVLGVGTVLWKFYTREGRECFLPLICYHVEHASIRLMSPQQYFKSHGGHADVTCHNVAFHLPDKAIIDIPICPKSNLPTIRNVGTTTAEQKRVGADIMGTANHVNHFDGPTFKQDKASDFATCLPCVADETNQQLTGPQKEVLLWHWKWSINMQHVQELMQDRVYELDNGTKIRKPPIIPTKHATSKSCKLPMCMSCELSKMKSRSPKVKVTKAIKEKAGILSRDSYEPGDMVSSDQFNVHTTGRKLSGYGRESSENGFHGGTVFVDASSGLVRVEMQVSLGANETVIGKHKFEQWIYDLASVCVKRYHSDNGIYDSQEFRDDCIGQEQSQTFSGVGAKHQNAVAERYIQTLSYWARTMMVHAAIHWPSHGADNLRHWPFAMKHAEWLYNHLPNRKSGLTPLELFTKQRSDHRDLLRAHVWGCPVYVLDPTLQDGKKIPKWNKRSRLGQFLGFSDEHSSLVGRVRHLGTNYVSPQYHVVYDDLFETIYNGNVIADANSDTIFNELFENARENYAPAERDDKGDVIFLPPPLNDIWLSESERREKRVELERRRVKAKERWMKQDAEIEDLTSDTPPPLTRSPMVTDDEDSSDDESDDDSSITPSTAPTTNPISSPSSPEGDTIPLVRRSRRENKGTRRGPTLIEDPNWNYTSIDEDPNATFAVLHGTRQTPVLASPARVARSDRRYQAQFNRRVNEYEEFTLNTMDWGADLSFRDFMETEASSFFKFAMDDTAYNVTYKTTMRDMQVDYVDPFILAAKTAASSADNPNWDQAMRGPFADEYYKAAEVEVETLENINAWDVVERDVATNILPGTWTFKCKRYPDGSVKKFKARFCARGDRQKEGIDFTETYAPVAQWTTVRTMLILECLLGLKSKQGDISCAFLHAELTPDEKIYVDMPRGFKQYDNRGRPKILSLNRFLYGLRQSPRAFWQYLTQKLESCGLKQSKLDPCLFIGTNVIVVTYVDDVLFWSTDEKYIYELGSKLREAGVDLEEESDAAGFLGVDLVRLPDGRIHLKQPGLIKRIIDALGFDINETSTKKSPAERQPLVKDEDGEPAQETFSYASIVGMLLYLSGHTRPDLSYSVSQAARFMFAPKRSHEVALKRIGRYLCGTADKGTIFDPKNAKSLHIDAYPDADFAGLYGYESTTDPVCVRSRTGYVIAVANCPVVIYSSLQTETALSTMQAEIYALCTCCKALFPLIKMVKELSGAVGLPVGGPPTMKITLHEDNTGALILAKTIPPEFTPRSKFYALKTIWCREQILELNILVVKIDTKLQWGDICTKQPPVVTYEFLRKMIQGW